MSWFPRNLSSRARSLLSPAQGEVVLGMATQMSRLHTAPLVLHSALREVDRVVLHLDGFPTIPEWARDRRITVRHFPEGSNVGAAGKLEAIECAATHDIIVVLDDDVRLRPGSIRKLVTKARLESLPTVVGYHGSLLSSDFSRYVEGRTVINLPHALARDTMVDVMATCFAAFRVKDFMPRFRTWKHKNVVDLQFSLEAATRGVALKLLRRRKNYLSFIESRQPDSIYGALLRDDSRQTVLAKEIVNVRAENHRR